MIVYNMIGRTYRYFDGKVQYPFGFGLSYTSFDYAWKQEPGKINSINDTLVFSATIKNTGSMDGDEVTQIYIKYPDIERMPLKELKGFKRITIIKGQEQTVQFHIPVTELQKWDMKGKTMGNCIPVNYTISIGSSSQDIKVNICSKNKKSH
jgi:beta-glucosidase